MGTRRTQRLSPLILAELAELLLRRVKDPRLEGINLTGVDVSPDLGQAKVFYSLVDQARRPEVEKGFFNAAPFLRRELASRLQIKTTPRLIPVFDPSIARGLHMDQVIREARAKDEAAASARGDEPEAEDAS
jgi:ribosome-binding factor A